MTRAKRKQNVITLRSAVEEFILSRKVNGGSSTTTRWYRSMFKLFVQQFGDLALDEIGRPEVRRYISTLQDQSQRFINALQKPTQDGPLSRETQRDHIRALRIFFNWCVIEYGLAETPMAGIKMPPKQRRASKHIVEEEIIKLFAATGKDENGIRDRAILAFLLDSGCRAEGLVNLTVADVDLGKIRALVDEKYDKQRLVFFSNYTAQVLKA